LLKPFFKFTGFGITPEKGFFDRKYTTPKTSATAFAFHYYKRFLYPSRPTGRRVCGFPFAFFAFNTSYYILSNTLILAFLHILYGVKYIFAKIVLKE
jgi:hypothetical protein